MNRLLSSVLFALLMLPGFSPVLAQDNDWPRTLPLEQGMVTIYSLQVDEMDGDVIHFRAALAYRETADAEPVFGAGWFESRVEIDRSGRIVHPTDLKVTETRFPEGTYDVQSGLSAVLAQQSPVWNLDFSLDELEASLKTAKAEAKAVEKLNTDPPRIIYRDHPALLISIDGEPILREIEDSPLKAVINTPYPLITDGRRYYLNVARDVWYSADGATGPYQLEMNPPAEIAAMVNAGDAGAAEEQPAEAITAANAPEIVVSTEPAELIVTEGPAAFVPLVDDLLVLQNSDDDVFMHVSSQKFYIVLSGRWYQASSLNGPWTYQPADDLPTAFANIPQDSNQSDARVYVAGTQEARDAVLDAHVPQTAAVARGEVDIDVEYDGDPNFEPVDGADLAYANNTGSTVIESNGLFYLVEDGVWYVATSPAGPWQVSDHRPQQVDSILPTSPVYNVKYVYVYDSTPNVVYVGYTPGYMGSYVYHNTIFYGSGWYYRPWVSPYYYYPRHSTWGFNVSYNWWSGWNFGLSWGWGPFSVSYFSGGYWHRNHYWHHRHYGRWGPGRYRGRPVHHRYGRYGHRNRGHGRGGYDRNPNDGHRSNSRERNDNLYRGDGQRARIADTRDRQPGTRGRRGGDGRREPAYAGPNKGNRSRTEPVRTSELREKADLRDANNIAARSRLLADSRGDVYRRAGPGQNRGKKNGLAGADSSVRRTKQSTADASSRETRTRAAASRARQYSSTALKSRDRKTQPGTGSDRAKQRSLSGNKTAERQPKSIAGSKQARAVSNTRASQRALSSNKTSDRQAQSRAVSSSRASQRALSAIKAPDQRAQPRAGSKRVSQRPPSTARTPDRRSQPAAVANSTRQRSSQVASAPAQRQSRSRPASTPKSSRNGGGRRNASRSDGGRRSGDSRTRRR